MQTQHRLFHLPHHKTEYLSLLYIVATIRTFVVSSLNVFIPIYLYNNFLKLGFIQKDSIVMTGIYVLFFTSIMTLCAIPVAKINSKYGIRIGFIIGQVFQILFFIFSQLPFTLFTALCTYGIFGMALAFWWTSYHTYFVEMGKPSHFGKEVSVMEIFGIFAGLFGPLFGGIILTFYGFSPLFMVSIVIIIFSIILLLYAKENNKSHSVTIQNVVNESKIHRTDLYGFAGVGGVETIYTFVWPLFLYVLIQNYLNMGFIVAFITGVTLIMIQLMTTVIDKISKEKLGKLGSGLVSGTWVGRILFQQLPIVLVFDALFKVFYNTLFNLPLTAIAYNKAQHEHKAQYIVFRELSYRLGDISSLLLFIFLIYKGFPLWTMFIIAAFFSLLPLLIKEQD